MCNSVLGRSAEFNWAMWLQIVLTFSGLTSHYVHPYELKADNRSEQMTFLGLVAILSITNSGLSYSGQWQWYHILVISVVIILSICSTVYIEWQAMKVQISTNKDGKSL